MKKVDIAFSVLLIALGILHCTGSVFNAQTANLTASAWEFSGGLFTILVGAVNLLRIRYGAIAGGVRWVSAGANVSMLGLSVVLAGALGMAHHMHSVGVILVVLVETVFSFVPPQPQTRAAAER